MGGHTLLLGGMDSRFRGNDIRDAGNDIGRGKGWIHACAGMT